jgi:UDP-glucose 4-epimerase
MTGRRPSSPYPTAPQGAAVAGKRVVLVTGVSGQLGARLARSLQQDPSVRRVIGVDVTAPRTDLGRTEFVRADIRNPIIAKVLSTAAVDTVVHLSLIPTPLGVGGRTAMKELNVIGMMQLLAACQKAPGVRRLVVRSTAAVYGSSSRDPALFTEQDEPRALPRSGYAKDAVEIEGYVRGFGRRRPDVSVTTLRFSNVIGPTADTPLTRYFSLPVVPRVLGFDPRVQFVHETDALEVLRLATLRDRGGTFNVSGPGVLLLSQAVRRAGRPAVQVPTPAVSAVGGLLRRIGAVDFSPDQLHLLLFGRVLDITRLVDEFGYQPRYSSLAAFDDFVAGRGLTGYLTPELLASVEQTVLARLAAAHA